MKPNPKYLNIFRTEAVDLIGRIAGQLLEVEGGGADFGALRQDLHTLKGSSRLVGLVQVGQLVHGLETFAGDDGPLAARSGRAVDLALEVLDQVEGLSGLGKPEPSEDEIAAVLARMETFSEAAPEPPKPSPKPSPPAEAEEAPRRQADLTWEPSTESVRVTVEILDQLLNLSGELLLQHQRMVARFDQGQQLLRLVDSLRTKEPERASQLTEVAEAMEELVTKLEGDMADAGFLFSEVRERTAGIRMQPLSTLFEGLERQVRGEARRLGKPLRFVVRGGRLQLDRTILEQLKPVMIHCLTNSVVHGIEPVDVRVTAGKPEEGTLLVAASSDGNRIHLVIEDDGRGLDPSILRSAAIEKGFLTQEVAESLGDDEALSLIFTPGFSTAKVVGNMAGRGVGMDAVRANVERLRGQLRVESEQRRFTRITLVLPASIGVIRGVLLEVGGEHVVLPASDVDATYSARTAEVDAGRETMDTPRGEVPCVALEEALGWSEGRPPVPRSRWAIRLHPGEEGPVALLVDAVLGEEEIVLKHPGEILAGVPLIAGATILGEGRPALILSVPELRRVALEVWQRRTGAVSRPGPTTSPPRQPNAVPPAPPPASDGTADAAAPSPVAPSEDTGGPADPVAPPPARVLVADDSETARNMLRDTLEEAGIPVRVAEDGRQALGELERGGVVVLVTDFDMPHLNGLELVEALRGGGTHCDLPVLMITDKAGQIDEQAMALGVKAVLPKTPETYAGLGDRVRSFLPPTET